MAGDNYNVSQIMDTWVLQMGFPVIDVTRTGHGMYKLSQSRFLSNMNTDLSGAESKSIYRYVYDYILIFSNVVTSKTQNRKTK